MPIPENEMCCHITDDAFGMWNCSSSAEWIIRHGKEADEYTVCCTVHVGAMLTDAPEHRIYPITEDTLTGSYNQWDLPHHAEVGRGQPKNRKKRGGPNVG